MACSLSSVYITCFPAMLITFTSKVTESGDNKIAMLPRIFYYLVYNCSFSRGLRVLVMDLWSIVRYISSRCCSSVPSKPVPSRISSSLSSANSTPSFINRQVVAAQMNKPLDLYTSCVKTTSPGQSAPRAHSYLIIPRLCSRNREMLWLITVGDILYSIKS
jgi:hypothetical protein